MMSNYKCDSNTKLLTAWIFNMTGARKFFPRTLALLTKACSQSIMYTPEGAVSISYPTLKADPLSLRTSIGELSER